MKYKVGGNEMTQQEYENRISQLQDEIEELKKAKILDDNPFDVKNGEKAYYNAARYTVRDDCNWKDIDFYDYVPCKDKSIVEARQKRHHLSDLLEKFASEHNAVVTDGMWKDANIEKYYIYYIPKYKEYNIVCAWHSKDLSTIYFTSEEVAERAVKEVVLPFERGELL